MKKRLYGAVAEEGAERAARQWLGESPRARLNARRNAAYGSEHLARGRAVAVVPVESEITTQQAAEMLNVSRPYLVDLLEQGAIPFRKVGGRRRFRLVDVLVYREIDDAKRRSAMDELTAEARRLGLGY